MKDFLTALAVALVFVSAAVGSTETQVQYLSGTDRDQTVNWDFKVSGGRNANTWKTIPVPSNWEMQGFGTYRYWCDWCDQPAPDSEGLYRYRFTVPAEWKNKNISIVFGGVMTDAEVKVNDTLAGPVHRGGFYQFSYPVTELLSFDRENLLEVKVNRFSSDPSINLAERRADFWLFSGIYRPVWLEAKPRQHIERVDLHARHTGDFRAKVSLQAGEGERRADRLVATVHELGGKRVGKPFSVDVPLQKSAVEINSHLKKIVPWSAENPQRYRVVFHLWHGREVLHEVAEVFGFRTVDLRPGDGLYINGGKVRLKGANRHSLWPDSGRTTSAKISEQDVKLMKEMNMNAVRVAHYPPDRHFLEATDKYGLYVINELTGWQDAYDTDAGEPLVKELIQRDANHPSVIVWANGNEGGWNKELDDDFHQWDIQKRPVVHPWDNFGGINTAHYNGFNCCTGTLFHGHDLIMPTEFLHGLYDGGGAAGLDDWWKQIMGHPLAVGGFIWALVDEGIVRDDQDGAIDVAGNSAPDGIVGPYREKEGSFFAIKEIWSPVYLPQAELDFLPDSFDGSLRVENRYDFTNLNQVSFQWQLVTYPSPQSKQTGHKVVAKGKVKAPDVPSGLIGKLSLDLPENWQRHDALYLTATDQYQKEIYTWSWMIAPATNVAQRILQNSKATEPVSGSRTGNRIDLTRDDLRISIDATTGYLQNVTKGSKELSLARGPRLVHGDATLKTLTHRQSGEGYIVRAEYDGILKYVEWQLRADGWLQLDYAYQMPGGAEADYLGVTFDYPEDKVKVVTWLGKGPYRVWKNRLKGVEFDVWQKEYNDTVTGLSWDYPEFKGFYDNVYWAVLNTSELPVTMAFTDGNMLLRLFTPTESSSRDIDPMKTHVSFPAGDLSFLQGIAPIGTKFHAADEHGPNGGKNAISRLGGWYESAVFFNFLNADQ